MANFWGEYLPASSHPNWPKWHMSKSYSSNISDIASSIFVPETDTRLNLERNTRMACQFVCHNSWTGSNFLSPICTLSSFPSLVNGTEFSVVWSQILCFVRSPPESMPMYTHMRLVTCDVRHLQKSSHTCNIKVQELIAMGQTLPFKLISN